jgi:hypothetical protein
LGLERRRAFLQLYSDRLEVLGTTAAALDIFHPVGKNAQPKSRRVSPPAALRGRFAGASCDLLSGLPFARKNIGGGRGHGHCGRPAQSLARRDRLQVRNYPSPVFARRESAIRLHIVARDQLVRICDEALELFSVPHEVCTLHRAGVAIIRQCTGLPSNDLVEVRQLRQALLNTNCPDAAS